MRHIGVSGQRMSHRVIQRWHSLDAFAKLNVMQ
jgi:hypothetical protein